MVNENKIKVYSQILGFFLLWFQFWERRTIYQFIYLSIHLYCSG